MAPKRPPVLRRDFPSSVLLEAWRSELAVYGFSLAIGKGGYWYAVHNSGLVRFSDRLCKRTYTDAMAYAITNADALAAIARNSELFDGIAPNDEEE